MHVSLLIGLVFISKPLSCNQNHAYFFSYFLHEIVVSEKLRSDILMLMKLADWVVGSDKCFFTE